MGNFRKDSASTTTTASSSSYSSLSRSLYIHSIIALKMYFVSVIDNDANRLLYRTAIYVSPRFVHPIAFFSSINLIRNSIHSISNLHFCLYFCWIVRKWFGIKMSQPKWRDEAAVDGMKARDNFPVKCT